MCIRGMAAPRMLYWIFSLLLMAASTYTYAQHADSAGGKFLIRDIKVQGNRKTKTYVILREMQLHTGDTVRTDELYEALKQAREFIYNTTLFEEVNVVPILVNDHEMNLVVTVVEKWYLYPIPYLELADRSFNEWVHTYHADLKRLSYGLRFTHLNFSGNRDKLSLNAYNGFRRNISLEYHRPYINKALTNGMDARAGFSQTKQIPYISDAENHLLYYENGGYEKSEWNIGASYIFRKKLKKKEYLFGGYRRVTVSDSIIKKYNPDYFNSPSATQHIIDIEYGLQYDDVDNIMYPLSGFGYSFTLKKRGLGFNGGLDMFSATASFQRFMPAGRDWFASFAVTGEIKLPFDQPYYNLKALGYNENYLRGLEYFVVDGSAFGLAKFDLKKKIAHINVPTFFKSEILQRIPFTFYAKTYADAGYVYSKHDARLNNRFLYSGGVGLDIVTLYDFHVSIEFSLNQLGQKGLFLHRQEY